MAEHMAEQQAASENDLTAHQGTYRAFVRGALVAILATAFTLVALVAFAFGTTMPILLGWAILVIGLIAILIDLRSGSKTWRLTLVTLVIFGLLTAISIS
jgi:hypothetical protein